MALLKLENEHYEDIEDLIADVEREFDIKFNNDEFGDVKSLGELCDLIANKVPLMESESCTTQQAFYKVRQAIRHIGHVGEITPATTLAVLLPKEGRILKVRELERELGMGLGILSPPRLVSNIIWITGLFSTAGLFFDWRMFLPFLLLVILVGKIAYRFGKELNLETMSDLARKLTIDNCLAVRRDPLTINRKEFSEILIDRLNFNYDEDGKLTRRTVIG